ncbi:HAMP domain-containing histidine kinase [Erysipelotrichaceae bacterium OttesenSCG-928-M19]|nr:HAMP domain-containing histidine kinase [Erysipelotrichaceae bacterium OttesenSCG-928-M19]
MSGLNKQRKLFRKQLFIVVVIYIVFFIVVGLVITNLPNLNNKTMSNKVVTVKKDINNLLQKNSVTSADFADLVKEEEIQLIVKEEQKIIYSNTPVNDYNLLNELAADEHVFYKGEYTINNYDIWLLIYNKPVQDLMSISIALILIILLFMSIAIIAILRISFNSLMRPLDNLYTNLQKLKEYKFDGILTADQKADLFAQELRDFAQDIQAKVKDFEVVYTSLEKELMLQNKNAEYKTNVIASLVHNLKTPINVIKFSTLKLEKTTSLDLLTLENINESADDIVRDVDNILKISYQKEISYQIEDIDLSREVKRTVQSFNKLFQEKGLTFNNEIASDIKIKGLRMEIETILHNIFSNAYTYALNNSEIDVSLKEEDSAYSFKISNAVKDNSVVDYEGAFKLLNKNHSKKNSSGFGLYIVKRFSEKNNAECLFYPSTKGVTTEIRFNKGDYSHEKSN